MSVSELHIPTDQDDMSRPYWNAAIETMPVDAMREFQLRKLKHQVDYLYRNSELYKAKFDEAGFKPGDLRTIEDLAKIPFTTKQELRVGQDAHPPFGSHQAAPSDRIVRMTSTAGTTGKPVFQGYTKSDIAQRNESICRGLWAFGVRPGDRVINGFALSMFNAGVPFCTGIEFLGAVDVPAGAERKAEGVLKIARDVNATVFVGTPSFAAYLAEKAPEVLGIEAKDLGLRVICGGGESGFELPSFQREMERVWGTRHVYDWASTSDAHPNVFTHCMHRNGKHHMTPDLALVQLIDPATGAIKEISEGAEGEYIFTHLDRQACPLLRYRTGDILRVFTAPCACGRIGFRMDIIGRSDDMLIVRGLNLFPAAIQSLVGEFMPATTGKMQIVLRAPGPKVDPPLHVRVECNEGIEPSKSGSTRDAIEKRIRGDLNVTSAIELVPFGTFERTSTKTRLVIIDPSAKEPVS
jgi:phenylacetate-CoA ligase